jgi:hypothetical protein
MVRITGFRICIDERNGRTRSFGFLLMMSRNEVLQLSDKSFDLFGEKIVTSLTDSTSVLLSTCNRFLLDDRKK